MCGSSQRPLGGAPPWPPHLHLIQVHHGSAGPLRQRQPLPLGKGAVGRGQLGGGRGVAPQQAAVGAKAAGSKHHRRGPHALLLS
jgi:hypothetical protein